MNKIQLLNAKRCYALFEYLSKVKHKINFKFNNQNNVKLTNIYLQTKNSVFKHLRF